MYWAHCTPLLYTPHVTSCSSLTFVYAFYAYSLHVFNIVASLAYKIESNERSDVRKDGINSTEGKLVVVFLLQGPGLPWISEFPFAFYYSPFRGKFQVCNCCAMSRQSCRSEFTLVRLWLWSFAILRESFLVLIKYLQSSYYVITLQVFGEI